MKFLCDVHISYKLVKSLEGLGYTCLHVNSILEKWLTKDEDLMRFADENSWILVSKDSDFKNSHFIKSSPKKLIKINLGNISNSELIEIFNSNHLKFKEIEHSHSQFLIEINKDSISVVNSK